MIKEKNQKDIVVLGIHDGHNSGAALIKNGKVLAAISEERLVNIKNFSGIPELAIKKVYKIAGVRPEETDLIAIGCLVRVAPPLTEDRLQAAALEYLAPYLHSHLFAKAYVKLLHRFRKMGGLNKVFAELGIEKKEKMFIEHHLSHAACAYYQRPWEEEALVLTLDGSGDGLSATVNIGKNFQIKRIASTIFYDSIGNNLYSEITGYLGLKRWEHEYKVMGMAPYGRAEYCFNQIKKIVRINPEKPLEFQNTIGAYSVQIQKKLKKLLAGQRFDNITAATQKHTEELITQWVKNCIKETKIHKLACAGGVFLNVKANKLIRELPEVKDVFFYPAADDGGTPVGVALEGYYRLCEKKRIKPKREILKDLYFGQEFEDEEINTAIKRSKFAKKAKKTKDIEEKIAELVTAGKIVARFSGRDEWGPRALGNRSIIADPQDLRVIRKINFAIKHRDFWMPFAPSILEEDMRRYLVKAKPARYMIEAFDTKPAAEEIIAALHPYDRTCRPQTVNEWNPGWKKILRLFKKKTGVAGVLNTSFNLHGFPIVGSPGVALETLAKSQLDALVLGNFLITR